MPSWPNGDRRWEWDRRSFEDRRRPPESKGDGARGLCGSPFETTPDTVRPYAFRSFSDRRRRDDRRTADGPDERVAEGSRRTIVSRPDGRTVELTREEVLTLLHKPEE